jgi:hypothetical protein
MWICLGGIQIYQLLEGVICHYIVHQANISGFSRCPTKALIWREKTDPLPYLANSRNALLE